MKTSLFLLIFLVTVQGWWQVGHMLTAQIAQNCLEKDHPEVLNWANELINSINSLTDGRSNSFVESAAWADDIKEPGTNYLDSWHFTDRPINNDGNLIQLTLLSITYNSVDAMKRASSVFTNPSRNKYFIKQDQLKKRVTWSKAKMMRYILHIVGDMHQPLHNSNFYNDTFKSGDAGGNLIKVKYNGQILNLHAFWDAGAFDFEPTDNFITRPLNYTARELLKAKATKISEQYPISQFINKDMKNPEIWTQEGYLIAQNNVYPLFFTGNQVTSEYQKAAAQICQKQVALGGYRLAAYLTDLYQKVLKYETIADEGFVSEKLMEIRTSRF